MRFSVICKLQKYMKISNKSNVFSYHYERVQLLKQYPSLGVELTWFSFVFEDNKMKFQWLSMRFQSRDTKQQHLQSKVVY